MNKELQCLSNKIVIFKTDDGKISVDVNFDMDTAWLSLDQIAELFARDKSTISRHIKNLFEEGELQRDSVVAKFATTAMDEKTYQVDYYNLDVIISVGYRVKSLRGTQFRIWASNILKEYLKKGFALNDERLKNLGGGNYWKYPRSHAPAWECIPHPQSAFPRGSVGMRKKRSALLTQLSCINCWERNHE